MGVVNEIICSDNNYSSFYPELMEIRICLSKTTFNPTKCLGLDQVKIGRECGGAIDDPEIIYPHTELLILMNIIHTCHKNMLYICRGKMNTVFSTPVGSDSVRKQVDLLQIH